MHTTTLTFSFFFFFFFFLLLLLLSFFFLLSFLFFYYYYYYYYILYVNRVDAPFLHSKKSIWWKELTKRGHICACDNSFQEKVQGITVLHCCVYGLWRLCTRSAKRARRSYGLAPQTVAKRTWSEALDGALRVLAEERKAGTSLSWSYLGGKFPGIRFRATGCLRALQLFVSFRSHSAGIFCVPVFGFQCLDANNICLHLPEYVYQRLIDSWTIS